MRREAQNQRGMRTTNAEELGYRGLLCDNTIQPEGTDKMLWSNPYQDVREMIGQRRDYNGEPSRKEPWRALQSDKQPPSEQV